MEREKISSLANQIYRPFQIIFSSTKVFLDLEKNPTWGAAYLMLAVGSVLTGFLILPFVFKVEIAAFSRGMNIQQVESGIDFIKKYQTAGILISPLVLLIKFLLISTILWLIVMLEKEASFKRILSVIVHCGIIPFLSSLLSIAILYSRGMHSIKNIYDLQVFLGLDMFLRNYDLNLPLKIILGNINVFSIWWIVIVGSGLSITAKISKIKATLMTIALWIFNTAVQIGTISLIGSLKPVG